MRHCARCLKGSVLGDSCYACGWNPESERQRLISEALVAGEKQPREQRRKRWPRQYQLSLLDERNLRALREMA